MLISPYTIILASSALITSLISLYVLRCRTCRASHEFVLLLAAMSWWSALNVLESIAPTLDQKVFFSTIGYLGSQYAPVIYLLFTLRYTQMDGWLSSWRERALFIIPTFSLLMAATNPIHHLLWPQISLTASAFAGSYVIYTHGPWYWVEIGYSYTLLFAGMAAFFLASFRRPRLNSLQCRLMLAASLVPVAGNIGYAFFFTRVEGIDPTPLLMNIAGILIAIVITRFWFLDIIPIAREQVLESMNEGMIILDPKNRIVDINPAATRLLLISGEAEGSLIAEVLPWLTVSGLTN